MAFPKLPAKAAYITINKVSGRDTLSLSVLRDLRQQLHAHMTSPRTGELLTLPPFRKGHISIEDMGADRQGADEHPYAWLLDPDTWRRDRAGLPNALVLRSSSNSSNSSAGSWASPGDDQPVFSTGHDLEELRSNTPEQNRETFDLTTEITNLIRQSPAPVICPVDGLAAAAGFQLAMACDFPIALASTAFQLPGMHFGLPSTGAAAAVSRRIRPGQAYRLFATGESITAGQLGGAVLDVVPVPEHAESTDTAARAFEARVAEVVEWLGGADTAGQPQAFGKWAFWTQMGPKSNKGLNFGNNWAGKVMARNLQNEEAKEGIAAWTEKRKPQWKT